MLVLAIGVVSIGAGWVSGATRLVALSVMLASVVGLVWTAFVGGLETRRALAPYGLLKPGILWLSLFSGATVVHVSDVVVQQAKSLRLLP